MDILVLIFLVQFKNCSCGQVSVGLLSGSRSIHVTLSFLLQFLLSISVCVRVQEANSTGPALQLRGVGPASGGYYKCEVVSEAPGYYTADKSALMLVLGEH